mmetsp:Transcript_32645/g.96964  ORF Transcript_32645/g.96964 Transcript_32645/m.96964 type:complete len:175 (+) Transcript_32645:92-616(+)
MWRKLQAAAAALLGLALPATALVASRSHAQAPPTLADKAAAAAGPTFSDLDHDHDLNVTVHEAALFGMKNGVSWGDLRRMFVEVDKNHDHNMTLAEFNGDLPTSQEMLHSIGSTFTAVDLNGDELIDHDEWLAYCRGWMKPRPSHDNCEDLFYEASGRRGDKETVDRLEFAPLA